MKLVNIDVDKMQVTNNVVIKDKCGCKCKELIDKEICDKGFIWNLSNCECECEVGEYLDYKNCKCKKYIK